VASRPGRDKAHIDVCPFHILVWGLDPLERSQKLYRPLANQVVRSRAGQVRSPRICLGIPLPVVRRLVVFSEFRGPHVQLVDELEGRFPCSWSQPGGAQNG
jgi:hypothetical protein